MISSITEVLNKKIIIRADMVADLEFDDKSREDERLTFSVVADRLCGTIGVVVRG
jgi:hypothetical protein